jgi:hypothetical protein
MSAILPLHLAHQLGPKLCEIPGKIEEKYLYALIKGHDGWQDLAEFEEQVAQLFDVVRFHWRVFGTFGFRSIQPYALHRHASFNN